MTSAGAVSLNISLRLARAYVIPHISVARQVSQSVWGAGTVSRKGTWWECSGSRNNAFSQNTTTITKNSSFQAPHFFATTRRFQGTRKIIRICLPWSMRRRPEVKSSTSLWESAVPGITCWGISGCSFGRFVKVIPCLRA